MVLGTEKEGEVEDARAGYAAQTCSGNKGAGRGRADGACDPRPSLPGAGERATNQGHRGIAGKTQLRQDPESEPWSNPHRVCGAKLGGAERRRSVEGKPEEHEPLDGPAFSGRCGR